MLTEVVAESVTVMFAVYTPCGNPCLNIMVLEVDDKPEYRAL